MPDDSFYFLAWNESNRYDVGKENPEMRTETTKENYGKVLPQGTGIVLADFAARMPYDDFNRILGKSGFNGFYHFEQYLDHKKLFI